MSVAGLVAGLLDRLDDEFERRFGGRQVGGEAAFVADIGVVPGLLQGRLRVWKISEPMRSASAKDSRRPAGS